MPPLPADALPELIRDYLPSLVIFVFFWFVLPKAAEIVGQYNAHRMQLQTATFQRKMDFAEQLLESSEKEQERHMASEESFRRTLDTFSLELIGLRASIERLTNRFDEYIQSNKEQKS